MNNFINPLCLLICVFSCFLDYLNAGRIIRIDNPSNALCLAEVEVYSNGINIASTGVASQSGTFDNAHAGLAIDGNKNRIYANGSVAHTSGITNQWWELRIENDVEIEKVIVFNRSDGVGWYLNDFSVSILDLNRDVIWSNEPVSTALWKNLFMPFSFLGNAKFVRIENPTDPLCLAEVEVYSNGINIAPTGVASQSSTFESAHAGLAIDGNKNVKYANGSVTHTLDTTNQWWEVSLSEVSKIDMISVVSRGDGKLKYLKNFSVSILDESRNVLWSSGKISGPCPHNQFSEKFNTESNTGMIIRIENPKNALCLAEVQVFSKGENIALAGIASQSSTLDNAHAGLAIDGDSNRSYAEGSVTHTLGTTDQWWELKINEEIDIDEIVIISRGDGKAWYLNEASLSVLDFDRNVIWESKSIQQFWYENSIKPFFLDGKAKYIKIFDHNNPLCLTEVEVYRDGMNIAPLGAATQSSTLDNAHANLAIDGGRDVNYLDGSVTHTSDDRNQWWELSLHEETTIDKIEILGRGDGKTSYLDNYKLSVLDSNRNVLWDTDYVYWARINQIYINTKENFYSETYLSYVKQPKDEVLYNEEVEIIFQVFPDEEIQGSYELRIDNKPNWMNLESLQDEENKYRIFGTPGIENKGAYENITISLLEESGFETNLPTFDLEVVQIFPLDVKEENSITVRITNPNDYLHLSEVQVFSNGENVALLGSARQSSGGGSSAQKAIDDIIAHNNFSHTSEWTNQWWEVTINNVDIIDEIVIYNRKNLESRLDGFYITIMDEDRNPFWESGVFEDADSAISIKDFSFKDNEFPTATLNNVMNYMTVGHDFVLNIISNDPDNDELIYIIENCPDWMINKSGILNSDDNIYIGRPTQNDAGFYEDIKVIVSDMKGGVVEFDSFDLLVSNNHTLTVRIENPRDFLHLREVEVFSGGNNVALFGSVSQASGYDEHKVIDGNKNNYSHSSKWIGQWIEIKLYDTEDIDEIVVYNRFNLEDRLDGFSVSILDNNDNFLYGTGVIPKALNIHRFTEFKNNPPTPIINLNFQPNKIKYGAYVMLNIQAENTNGDSFVYHIENPPSWMEYYTGQILSGTSHQLGVPDEVDVGLYENIIVKVSDKMGNDIYLPPFDIEVVDKPGFVVKINNPDNFVHLSEIKIYSDGKNVALEGSAIQTGTSLSASYAVDGIISPDNYSHTSAEYDDEWLEINMYDIHDIERIIIHNRDGFESRLKNSSLTILNENGDLYWPLISIDEVKDIYDFIIPGQYYEPIVIVDQVNSVNALEESVVSFSVDSIIDKESLSYSFENLPPFSNFDLQTKSIILNPQISDMGIYDNIKIIVNDGYSIVQSSPFSIEVNYNFKPTIEFIRNPTDITRIDQLFKVSVVGNDYETETSKLNYVVENKPSWTVFENNTLSGTPSIDDVGVFEDIIFKVFDEEGAYGSISFDLRVINGVLNSDGSTVTIDELLSEVPQENHKISLQGDFNVGGTGAASYSVPLPIPSGTGGLTSPLAINYSSNKEDGPLGVGFELGGIDAIFVSGREIKHDEKIWPAELVDDSSDYLEFNKYQFTYLGQRLYIRQNSNGTIHYTPESSPQTQVVYTHSNQTFIVKDSSGLTKTYAKRQKLGENLEYTAAYWLTKVEDNFGNNYTISYDDANGFVPIKIAHDHRNNAEGFQLHVDLNYTSRSSMSPSYNNSESYFSVRQGLFKNEISKILTDVTVYKNNQKFSEFSFHYKKSLDSHRPQLETIRTVQYTKNGTAIQMDDLNFVWSDEKTYPVFPDAPGNGKPTPPASTMNHNDKSKIMPFAFDGLGNNYFLHLYDDQLDNNFFPIKWKVSKYVKGQQYFQDHTSGVLDFSDLYQVPGLFPFPVPDELRIDFSHHDKIKRFFLTGDVNGNGKQEFIYIEENFKDTTTTSGILKVCIFNFTGSQFTYLKSFNRTIERHSSYQLLDMNIDGKLDLVQNVVTPSLDLSTGELSTATVRAYTYNLDEQTDLSQLVAKQIFKIENLNVKNVDKSIFITFKDENMDGYLDMVVIYERKSDLSLVYAVHRTTTMPLSGDVFGNHDDLNPKELFDNKGFAEPIDIWMYNGDHKTLDTYEALRYDGDIRIHDEIKLADINGDAHGEVLRIREEGDIDEVDVYNFNLFSSVEKETLIIPSNTMAGETKWVLGNFNGDTKTDIMRWVENEVDNVYENKFETYSYDGNQTLSVLNTTSNFGATKEKMELFLLNLDSDRDQDIVYFKNFYQYDERCLFHSAREQHPSDVVTSIEEGNEQRYFIYYNGDYEFDMGDVTYPTMKVHAPFRLVNRYRVQNDLIDKTYQLSYFNPLTNLTGDGFLGFNRRETYAVEDKVKTVEKYYQAYPMVGRLKESMSYAELDSQLYLINKTENDYQVKIGDSTPLYNRSIKIPYLDNSTVSTYDPMLVYAENYSEENSKIAEVYTQTTIDTMGLTTNLSTRKKQFVRVDSGSVPYSSRTIETENINLYETSPAFYSTTWNVARLKSAKVKTWEHGKTYPHDATYRISNFTYYPSGALKTEQLVGEPKKEYTYDIYGNLNSVKITAPDIDTRFSETISDSRGKVLVSKSYLNYNTAYQSIQQSSATYDAWTDVVETETDANGLVTRYYYDRMARNVLTVGPDNTYALNYSIEMDANSYDPDMPNGVVRAKTISKSSGSSYPSYSFIDANGHTLRTVGYAKNGQKVYKDRVYDSENLLEKESNNYYSMDVPDWRTFEYDKLKRMNKVINFDASYRTIKHRGGWTTSISVASNGKMMGNKVFKDINGQVVKSIDYDPINPNDASKSFYTVYEYEPRGKMVKMSTQNEDSSLEDIVLATYGYDSLGRRTTVDSIESGLESTEYYSTGEIFKTTDVLGQVTTTFYDEMGRVTTVTNKEGVTNTVYDTRWIGAVSSVTHTGSGHTVDNYYDVLGRLDKITQTIEGQVYTEDVVFDHLGREKQRFYPDGFSISRSYTNDGFLEQVKNASTNEVYWTHGEINEHGQVKNFTLGNGIKINNTYYQKTGLLDTRTATLGTATKHSMTYGWNSFAALTSRSNNQKGLSETFSYDHFGRLENNYRSNGEFTLMAYYKNGNIKERNDYFATYLTNQTRTYHYDANQPHAVDSVTENGSLFASYIYNDKGEMTSGYGRSLAYNSFGKLTSASKGGVTVSYTYGIGGSKIYRESVTSSQTVSMTTVNALYEIEREGSTTKHHRHIEANGGVIAVSTKTNETEELKYFLSDHLGSVIATFDQNGNIDEEFSYDAWGGTRNANTWQLVNPNHTSPHAMPGFTGHEKENALGLIHMNGRVYDPILARFTSADPFVKDMTNTQDLNRYTYVRNSPLNIVDPSGYFGWEPFKDLSNAWQNIKEGATKFYQKYGKTVLAIVAVVVTSWIPGVNVIVAGAIAGALSAGITTGWDLKSMMIGAVFGAIGAGIGGGILTDGILGGLRSKISGGSFKDGFIGGAAGAFGGSVIGQLSKSGGLLSGNSFGMATSRVAASAVVGGTVSKVSGGKFSNGAVSGAFARAFNEIKNNYQGLSKRTKRDIAKSKIAKKEIEAFKVELKKSYDWLKGNYPDLTKGISYDDIKVQHSLIMGKLSGFAPGVLYGGKRIIISASAHIQRSGSVNIRGVTDTLAHEMMHIQDGLPATPSRHDQIYERSFEISMERIRGVEGGGVKWRWQ